MAQQQAPLRMKDQVLMAPWKGVNRENPPFLIDDKELQDCLNFFDHESELTSRPEPEISQITNERIIGVMDGYTEAGVRVFVAVTPTSVYGNSGGAWTKLTGTLHGNNSTLIRSTDFLGLQLFCNGIDPIQQWDGVSPSFAALPNAPIAKFIAIFDNRVFAGFTTEGGITFPARVRYCVDGIPDDWTGPGSGFNDLISSTDPLTGLGVVSQYLVATFNERLEIGSKTGDGLNPIRWDTYAKKGAANICPYSFDTWGNFGCFVARDDIYLFDGATLNRIGGSSRRAILQDIRQGSYEQVYGKITDAGAGRTLFYYWLICPNGAIWLFGLQTQSWLRMTFPPRVVSVLNRFLPISVVRIQDLVGTIAQQNWIINLVTAASQADDILFGFTDGAFGRMSFTLPTTSSWKFGPTKTFNWFGAGETQTVKRVVVTYRDLAVGVAVFRAENELGQSITQNVTFGVDGSSKERTKFVDFTLTGERISFQITGNFPIGIAGIRPFYTYAGPVVVAYA